MPDHLMLVSPSANRVYGQAAPALAAAELAVCAGDGVAVEPTTIAGVDYLAVSGAPAPRVVGVQSGFWAWFERDGERLLPVEVPAAEILDDDLVTIPKYQGKTNEQFTRLLLNVTLSQVRTARERPDVLDPLCGRGTTLTTAWRLGLDAAGVDADPHALEQLNSFLRTWLRRKRLKHSIALTPVRREGKSLGKRLDAELRLPDRAPLGLSVFTGDTRDTATLWGKRRFDAVVTDAPYGVVHGSRSDVRGGGRDRSAAGLLRSAVPVWARMLRPGGALGVAWNTYGLTREDLAEACAAAGLEVRDEGAWRGFSHRVDAAIQRDVLVAVRP